MGRQRKTLKTLVGTRIYKRRKHYWFEPKKDMLDPVTGKVGRYHQLCLISDGEHKARCRVQQILGAADPQNGSGDFTTYFHQWRDERIAEQNEKAPTDPDRLKIHVRNIQSQMTWYRHIESAFRDFDVIQIRTADLKKFLTQWRGRRSAEVLHSYLSMFFQWCAGEDHIEHNPAREVKLKKAKRRTVLITHEQFQAVRLAAPASGRPHKDGTRTIDHDGRMLQIYVELLYLMSQRGTDVRLLKWTEVTEEGIVVEPTKTSDSTGKIVLLPMTPALEETLSKARALGPQGCRYVVHDRKGNVYDAGKLASRFRLVCRRLGHKGFTLKDIRAKSATDAWDQGHTEEELKVTLVHTSTATTRIYLRGRKVEKSTVRMTLPGQDNPSKEDASKPGSEDDSNAAGGDDQLDRGGSEK